MMIISKSKIANMLLLFALVFTSGHAFQTIFEGLSYIPFLGAVAFIGIGMLKCRRVSVRNIRMLISFVIPPIFTMILDGSNIYYYLIVVCGIIFAYGVSLTIPFNKIINVYLKLMTFTSIVALIGYSLYNTTDLLGFLPKMQNTNGKEYAIGFIFNVLTRDMDRNCGMFWEPGLFATALTIAMIFEILFKRKKISKFRMILFILCFITANSSAGFILCFLCLSLLFLRNLRLEKSSAVKNIICIVVLICFIAVLLNLDTIIMNSPLRDNQYFVKLTSDNVKASTRYLAIWHNLVIFSKNPVFGAGVSYVNQNMQYVADTSTITHMMSIFGLLGIWYTLSWCVGILKIKNVNFLAKIVLIVITMMILNKEPHLRLIFSWCLLFYLNTDRFTNNTESQYTGREMKNEAIDF